MKTILFLIVCVAVAQASLIDDFTTSCAGLPAEHQAKCNSLLDQITVLAQFGEGQGSIVEENEGSGAGQNTDQNNADQNNGGSEIVDPTSQQGSADQDNTDQDNGDGEIVDPTAQQGSADQDNADQDNGDGEIVPAEEQGSADQDNADQDNGDGEIVPAEEQGNADQDNADQDNGDGEIVPAEEQGSADQDNADQDNGENVPAEENVQADVEPAVEEIDEEADPTLPEEGADSSGKKMLESLINELKAFLKEINGAGHKARHNACIRKNRRLEKKRVKCEEEVLDLETVQIPALRKEVEELANQVHDKETALQALRDLLASQEDTKSNLEKEIEGLDKDIAAREEELSTLKSEHADLLIKIKVETERVTVRTETNRKEAEKLQTDLQTTLESDRARAMIDAVVTTSSHRRMLIDHALTANKQQKNRITFAEESGAPKWKELWESNASEELKANAGDLTQELVDDYLKQMKKDIRGEH